MSNNPTDYRAHLSLRMPLLGRLLGRGFFGKDILIWNKEFLDDLSVVSFYIGLKNYQENLSQSDKDDLIHNMSKTNEELLQRIEEDLEKQNVMLRDIIKRLDELESKPPK